MVAFSVVTAGRRITHAAKFDGLPVFNADGSRMMWTSQRGADQSSQVWLADFVLELDGDPAPKVAEKKEPAGGGKVRPPGGI